MRWHRTKVLAADFVTSKDAEEIAIEVERFVTQNLEQGDHKKAMKKLKVVPVGQETASSWEIFRIGLLFGYTCLLIVVTLLVMSWANCTAGVKGCWRTNIEINNENETITQLETSDIFYTISIRLFRPSFLVALKVLLFGVCIMLWGSVGINHALFFDSDLREANSAAKMVEVGLAMASLTGTSLLIWIFQFYIAHVTGISVSVIQYISLSHLAIFIVFFFNPFPCLLSNARFWLLKALARVFTAPFQPVRFSDLFIAEQLTSLLPLFRSPVFIVCCSVVNFEAKKSQTYCNEQLAPFYTILAATPYWIRFAQCLRKFHDRKKSKKRCHKAMLNALKYLIAMMFVATLSLSELRPKNSLFYDRVFEAVSMLLAFAAFLFWFLWDICVDWKLFKNDKLDLMLDSSSRLFRNNLTFRKTWFYYTVICVDFVLLALFWTAQVLSRRYQSYRFEFFMTFVTIGEVVRRFLWNLIRLESENVFNPAKLPVTTNVIVQNCSLLKPHINKEFERVDRMMTEEDGVNKARRERRASSIHKFKEIHKCHTAV